MIILDPKEIFVKLSFAIDNNFVSNDYNIQMLPSGVKIVPTNDDGIITNTYKHSNTYTDRTFKIRHVYFNITEYGSGIEVLLEVRKKFAGTDIHKIYDSKREDVWIQPNYAYHILVILNDVDMFLKRLCVNDMLHAGAYKVGEEKVGETVDKSIKKDQKKHRNHRSYLHSSREEIYEILKNQKYGMRLRDIAMITHKKPGSLSNLLARMIGDGLLVQPSYGKYAILRTL